MYSQKVSCQRIFPLLTGLIVMASLFFLASLSLAQPQVIDHMQPVYKAPGPGGTCPQGASKLFFKGKSRCLFCNQKEGYFPQKIHGKTVCVRLQMHPAMETPQGHKPKYTPLNAKGKCPKKFKPVTLAGQKKCAACNPGYIWHHYYGQGRCVKCPAGQSLGFMGRGKISCLKCPEGSLLSPRHPTLGYRCTCPGGKVMVKTPNGYKCLQPKKVMFR
ncbi:hypothetical protein [Dethiosulfatarculus sandiegensis]|uniref:Tyrosine-protein kinase ephrin type A/B receptor-like domain-containing protein n=1 Tax=Dethiosulfatarculus sandiegensis TaxID=1429043 RepID=A0A0D2JY05_9BACT|nr:hypothetical protein [Dethiosulfatarculus sandiegensis]KIX14440.1 hypothetical protein X474_09965 [Dethiosulfatarculus sandiegensis]